LSKLLFSSGAAILGAGRVKSASKSSLSFEYEAAQAPTRSTGGQTVATAASVQNMDQWATRIVANTEESDTLEVWEQALSAGLKYDLLIKGGTVIDPGQGLHGLLDVSVKNGKIFQVAKDIPPGPADRVVSAKGKIVTPGLIDLHLHCYDGITFNLNNVDGYCLGRGVTTVVDAGSTGYLGINKFIKIL